MTSKSNFGHQKSNVGGFSNRGTSQTGRRSPTGQSLSPDQAGSVRKDLRYSIDDDNDGFAKWLAYQLGLQMMWTHIHKNNKSNFDGDLQWYDPVKDPQGAFKRSFKYFYEEKMWKLAMVLYDEKAFDLVDFNQIVK